jgi:hypothetical protein
MLKRHLISKRPSVVGDVEYYGWQDFFVGNEVSFYGRFVGVCASGGVSCRTNVYVRIHASVFVAACASCTDVLDLNMPCSLFTTQDVPHHRL